MAEDPHSIQELFSTAFSQFGNLLRSEVRLAKAEVSANLSSAGTALTFVGGGCLVATAGLVLLLMAVSVWLQQAGLSEGAAHLLSAVVGIAAGGGLVLAGVNKLREASIAPTITMEDVGKDASAIKEQLK